MRVLSLEITEILAGRTVKNLLKRELQLSGSLISHLKYRPNGIMLNGQQVHTTQKTREGDVLSVAIGDDEEEKTDDALRQYILYEDADMLVLNKPAGMEMHPKTEQPNARSVKSLVCAYLGTPFHPVNRLDADTSGIMVVAKNRYMCDRLRRLLHTDDFVREYLAICCGMPKSGSITAKIDGASARTDYETLAGSAEFALVRVRLFTGKTHQIRIHMSGIGCPLLGDARYGEQSALFPRHALHSARMTLVHPLSGEALRICAPAPQDFTELAKRLFGSDIDLTDGADGSMMVKNCFAKSMVKGEKHGNC